MRILIIEDTQSIQAALYQDITALGFHVTIVSQGQQALAALHAKHSFYEVILLDMVLPDTDARQLIQAIKHASPSSHMIALMSENALETAREALRWGVSDFLTKPYCSLRLTCILQHVLQHSRQKPESHICPRYISTHVFFNGQEEAYFKAKSRFERAIAMGIPVLIEGERGTGKTRLARYLLQTILEPSLHTRCLDAANCTVEEFRKTLDITLDHAQAENLTPCLLIRHVNAALEPLQSVLLETIERDIAKDGRLRLITTATGYLMNEVKQNNFLSVLYTRLHAAPLWLAPLSQRPQDVLSLSQYFLKEANDFFGTKIVALTAEAQKKLCANVLPENISSLRQQIYKAVLQQSEDKQRPLQLPELLQENYVPKQRPPASLPYSYAHVPLLNKNCGLRPLQDIETDILNFAREHHHGHMCRISQELKIGRTTLYRKLARQNEPASRSCQLNQPRQDFTRAHVA